LNGSCGEYRKEWNNTMRMRRDERKRRERMRKKEESRVNGGKK
jgi:hypothetical protein